MLFFRKKTLRDSGKAGYERPFESLQANKMICRKGGRAALGMDFTLYLRV